MSQNHFTQEDLGKIRKLAAMLAQSGSSTYNGVRMDAAATALRKTLVILEKYLLDEDEREIHPITVREMYDQSKPSDLVVWTACRYMKRSKGEDCKHCPSCRHDEKWNDDVIDGCRLGGEELARFISAALVKDGWRPPE
jgi:hypothetical protein